MKKVPCSEKSTAGDKTPVDLVHMSVRFHITVKPSKLLKKTLDKTKNIDALSTNSFIRSPLFFEFRQKLAITMHSFHVLVTTLLHNTK